MPTTGHASTAALMRHYGPDVQAAREADAVEGRYNKIVAPDEGAKGEGAPGVPTPAGAAHRARKGLHDAAVHCGPSSANARGKAAIAMSWGNACASLVPNIDVSSVGRRHA